MTPRCEDHSTSAGLLLKFMQSGSQEKAMELLLNREWNQAELRQEGEDIGGNALYWASCHGWTLMAELLLTLGACVNGPACRASKACALHAAADNGRLDIIRLFIKWGADCNARNEFLDTPCHLAAYRGYAEVVCALLKGGADPLLRNRRDNTVKGEARAGNYCNPRGQHRRIEFLLDVYLSHREQLDADTIRTSGASAKTERTESSRAFTTTADDSVQHTSEITWGMNPS